MSPRQYAAQILALRDKEARKRALEQVPPEWHDLVKTHVLNSWHHPARNGKAR